MEPLPLRSLGEKARSQTAIGVVCTSAISQLAPLPDQHERRAAPLRQWRIRVPSAEGSRSSEMCLTQLTTAMSGRRNRTSTTSFFVYTCAMGVSSAFRMAWWTLCLPSTRRPPKLTSATSSVSSSSEAVGVTLEPVGVRDDCSYGDDRLILRHCGHSWRSTRSAPRGTRSMAARPLSTSTGSETCSCATNQP